MMFLSSTSSRTKSTEQQVLFQRIPWVNDIQAPYFLLLMCGATRANFWLRALRQEELSPTPFGLMRTRGLASDRFSAPERLCCCAHPVQTLSLSSAVLGLASAVRVRPGGHWSSWADSLRMVRHRHPAIAERMVVGLKSTTLLRVSVRSGNASKQFSTLVWRSLTGRSWPTALHLRRGSRAQSTQGWMAPAGHREVGTEVCARGGVACSQRQHKGFDAFAARTAGFGTVDCAFHVKGDPIRGPAVPRLPVSTFAPAFLCPCAPADVASILTCLAIIVQRVPRQGCWGGVAFLWRWPLPKCAVRQGPASPRTSMSATWIWPSSTSTDDVWRSSQTWCLVAEVGGRWSIETANFLVSLAKAKALASPYLQGRVQQGYIRRCSAMLAFGSPRVHCFVAGPPSSARSRGHPFCARGGS